MSQVVITGFGLHGGFGDARKTFLALGQGRSAVGTFRPEGVDGFPEVRGAQALPIDLDPFLTDRKLKKYMNPATALAVLAAGRALEDAGLLDQPEILARTALYVSTGLIAFDLSTVVRSMETCRTPDGKLDYQKMGNDGLKACHPLMPFKMLLNMPLGLVSIVFGIRGENAIFYPGSDQSAVGLSTAWRGIRHGRFEHALVGGSVQSLSLLPLSQKIRSGPGLAPADLSAFVVLESDSSARQRGAKALARLEGIAGTGGSETLLELWKELSPKIRPDRLTISGSQGDSDDRSAEQAARELWPEPVPLTNFDRLMGHGPAAAPFAALGLSSMMISKGSCRDVLVSSGVADQGRWALRLSSPEVESCDG